MEPVQLAPMLAVYEDDGEFTMRVADSALAKTVTPVVLKAIGEYSKARKLTLITPTDTKVFKFGGGVSQGILPPGSPATSGASTPEPRQPFPKASQRIIQDSSAPPAPELVEEEFIDAENQRALDEAAQAEKLQQQMARENSRPVEFQPEPEEVQEPRPRKRTPRPEPVPNAACGRCGGAGALDGGGTCPVCQGKGAISHYGRGRR